MRNALYHRNLVAYLSNYEKYEQFDRCNDLVRVFYAIVFTND